MKRVFTMLILILLSCNLRGQNQPLFDNYFTNNYLINPALTGIDPFPELQLTGRSQWKGIEGAPETLLVSFHTSLANPWASTSFSDKTPGKLTPYPVNASFKNHLGLGFIWFQDKIGPFKTTHIAPSFAGHVPLDRQLQLSLGGSINITRRSLDMNFLVLADPNDPLIDSFSDQTAITFRPGFLFSGPRFFIGGATTVNSDLSLSHTTAMLGVRFDDKYWHISYNIFSLIRYSSYNELNADLGLKTEFQDNFFLGGLIRSTLDFSVFTGVNLRENRLGFTFSYNTGAGQKNLADFQYNTMEVSLIFRLPKSGFLPCSTTPVL